MEALQSGLLDLLRKKIREHMNNETDYIAGGGCASFEEYKYKVGLITGLAVAERELLDIDERIDE